MDVYLDTFKFVPGPKQKISFSNPRVLAKLDIPGTAPDYQDMGEDEIVLAWNGALASQSAYQDAQVLEGMKNAGLPVQLMVTDCPELSRLVRIRRFDWDLVRQDYIPYTLELVAVPVPEPAPSSNVIDTSSAGNTFTIQAAPARVQYRTHTVTAGETLWSIAGDELKNPLRWPEVAKLNGIEDERKLRIGTVLDLPPE